MKTILLKIFDRLGSVTEIQPMLGLFLGGALLAVLLTTLFPARPVPESNPKPNLLWTIYFQGSRWLWAVTLVVLLSAALMQLRAYLHQTRADFERNHGRVTEANYDAVQTIWGAEQNQSGLHADLFWEERVTERIESEDITKPAVLRQKTLRHDVTANPYLSEHHEVVLRQNPRQKGSAFYDGYETDCLFSWKLQNPEARAVESVLTFPLPAAHGMYDNISATIDGADVLPQMELKDGSLTLTRSLAANETLDLQISFKSRGMSYWYYQEQEPREIRDFTLVLTLPDLPKSKLNYPGGCMTPTTIQPTADQLGSILTYRLDHAISNKGMGIALPSLPQPGATTSAVLDETERAWLLIFPLLVLGLTLAGVNQAVLWSILFSAATAFSYGLLGDFSDLLYGFWATAGLILIPIFALLMWLLMRMVPGAIGRCLAVQLLLYGIIYPSLAGLDPARQTLYFNLAAVVFLALATLQLIKRLQPPPVA